MYVLPSEREREFLVVRPGYTPYFVVVRNPPLRKVALNQKTGVHALANRVDRGAASSREFAKTLNQNLHALANGVDRGAASSREAKDIIEDVHVIYRAGVEPWIAV